MQKGGADGEEAENHPSSLRHILSGRTGFKEINVHNTSLTEADEALLMTNILMEAVFHHLCCRCTLKDRHVSGRDQRGQCTWNTCTGELLAPCSTDVTAPPLCSVMNAVIAAVWKFGLTVLI